MKRIFTSFFLCLFLLVACSQTSSTETYLSNRETNVDKKEPFPADFFPKSYTIVSVGDSLTQGVGDSTKRGGYLPYLEERLEQEKGIMDATIYNYGVSGNRTSQVLNRLKTQEVKGSIQKADIVMITTGGNDVMKVVKENFPELNLRDFDRELISYEKNLTSVFDTIRKENPDVTIGLIGLYNPFYTLFADVKEMELVTDKWNQVSQNVLARYDNTLFVGIAEIFKESEENLLYTDYFHPNDKGYQLMADKAFTVLQNEALENLYVAAQKENELDD
ncbi:SGNH/GDSL hydrolase family protein [Bacillaceae bacterium CLA-AA-H227]|uniref:SGNH/GDSL hydrolase family protein n=1 Tax=Robertmurraya yapensis (ex Hitch et al 2024) TaxID=3133160 RepID=A0ACC6SF45_9BACI